MDSTSSSFEYGIKSESTPKSILKKKRNDNGLKSRVLFSPTKEIKNFKDYFDSTEESLTDPRYRERRHGVEENEDCNREGAELGLTTEDERLINRVLTDSNIPYVLSLYLQLLFNLVILVSIIYFLLVFIRTIKSDINNKTELYISDLLQEISKCSREFYRNKCDNAHIPPVLESKCTNWSKCMNRDPHLLGKSKITAEILADILNGFVKPISWKTIFFLLVMIFGSLVITNLAFNTYRRSSNVDINQLELTIKHQQLVLALLLQSQNRHLGRGPYQSTHYLNDLDTLELSNPSPLAKKSAEL